MLRRLALGFTYRRPNRARVPWLVTNRGTLTPRFSPSPSTQLSPAPIERRTIFNLLTGAGWSLLASDLHGIELGGGLFGRVKVKC